MDSDVEKTNNPARGRWKLLAVLAVCAAPLLASYLTYFVIKPKGGETNYGALIDPRALASLFQTQQIGLRGPLCGPFGGLPFKHAAKFEHVLAQIGVGTHHFQPGIEEALLQRGGDGP